MSCHSYLCFPHIHDLWDNFFYKHRKTWSISNIFHHWNLKEKEYGSGLHGVVHINSNKWDLDRNMCLIQFLNALSISWLLPTCIHPSVGNSGTGQILNAMNYFLMSKNQSFWIFFLVYICLCWHSLLQLCVCWRHSLVYGCCNMASIRFMKGFHCILKLWFIIYLRFWKIWAVSCKFKKYSINKKYQKREGCSFWLNFPAVDTLRWRKNEPGFGKAFSLCFMLERFKKNRFIWARGLMGTIFQLLGESKRYVEEKW